MPAKSSARLSAEVWPTDRPKPYARNPRKIPAQAVAKVAASIQEFGFGQPIVVDRRGGGRCRLRSRVVAPLLLTPLETCDVPREGIRMKTKALLLLIAVVALARSAQAQLNVVDSKGKYVGAFESSSVYGSVPAVIRQIGGVWLELPISAAGFGGVGGGGVQYCCAVYRSFNCTGTAYFYDSSPGQVLLGQVFFLAGSKVYFLKPPAISPAGGFGSCLMFSGPGETVGDCLAPDSRNEADAACAAVAGASAAPLAQPFDLSTLKLTPPFHLSK